MVVIGTIIRWRSRCPLAPTNEPALRERWRCKHPRRHKVPRRRVLIEIAQLALEIAWIVVREDAGFAAAVADTLDHQGVVEFVR